MFVTRKKYGDTIKVGDAFIRIEKWGEHDYKIFIDAHPDVRIDTLNYFNKKRQNNETVSQQASIRE